ncbi:MAG: hypothetical protein GY820_07365 [Gammaproteobacteria bacterium]|nr:hypothetical protein [Gammaproteobacteria bacterium]
MKKVDDEQCPSQLRVTDLKKRDPKVKLIAVSVVRGRREHDAKWSSGLYC